MFLVIVLGRFSLEQEMLLGRPTEGEVGVCRAEDPLGPGPFLRAPNSLFLQNPLTSPPRGVLRSPHHIEMEIKALGAKGLN